MIYSWIVADWVISEPGTTSSVPIASLDMQQALDILWLGQYILCIYTQELQSIGLLRKRPRNWFIAGKYVGLGFMQG